MTGYTGVKGHDIPLGDFIMSVEISRKDGRYAISIANRMPDNPQILDAEMNNASVLRDGGWGFRSQTGGKTKEEQGSIRKAELS